MKEHFKTSSGTVNWLQILIGAAGLLVGTFVYLVDRPPDQTYFIYYSNIDISLYNIFPNLFGFIGNSFPAFIHVFSFILITAGLIASKKRDYLIICFSWFFADCSFELGQKFSSIVVTLVPDWFAGIPYLENTKNFFLSGTFDYFDLTAITIGAALAYLCLLHTMQKEKA
jgi:hypothetical protein